jgi:hypothetical protein
MTNICRITYIFAGNVYFTETTEEHAKANVDETIF